jgi:hypothetical protein
VAPEQRFQDRPQVVDGIAARGFEAQEEGAAVDGLGRF